MSERNTKQLPFLDRYLTAWTFLATALGVGVAYAAPAAREVIKPLSGRHDEYPDRDRADPDRAGAPHRNGHRLKRAGRAGTERSAPGAGATTRRARDNAELGRSGGW